MTGLIVVGVDGSDSSIDALRWAVGQAELTGASLEIVTAWKFQLSYGFSPTWPSDFDPPKDAGRMLSEIIERELKDHDELTVRKTVIEGYPAPVLLEAAEHADLLVVGSRGHGAFAGMLLGSVSEHCTSHAKCPVVVVRHQREP
jgi:nucleotide-binding universal stress UspA family protein